LVKDHGHLNDGITATTNTPVDRDWPEHAQRTPPADMRMWNLITVTNGSLSRGSVCVNTMRHRIGSDVGITVFGGVWTRGSLLTRLNAGITNADRKGTRNVSNSRVGSRGKTTKSKLEAASHRVRVQRACRHRATSPQAIPLDLSPGSGISHFDRN
jgi:hypothetical protein